MKRNLSCPSLFSSATLVAAVSFASLAGCNKSDADKTDSKSNQGNVAAPAAPAPTSEAVRASGSSALQPLVNAAKENYETLAKNASVEVSAGGSKKGLADVASGAVQIGNSDIFAPEDLRGALVDHKVAVVGFAAMANKGPYNADVKGLTMEQLAKVFGGAITNWKDLGGTNQPIVVINRAPGSGTRTVFGNVVLGGDKFIESQTEDNSGALLAKLKQTKGAISYLGLSFADNDVLTLGLKTDKGLVEPNAETITSGAYPIWSYEHMYTKGQPVGSTKAFLDYLLSDDFQKNVLPTVKGFIPVVAMKVSREKD